MANTPYMTAMPVATQIRAGSATHIAMRCTGLRCDLLVAGRKDNRPTSYFINGDRRVNGRTKEETVAVPHAKVCAGRP